MVDRHPRPHHPSLQSGLSPYGAKTVSDGAVDRQAAALIEPNRDGVQLPNSSFVYLMAGSAMADFEFAYDLLYSDLDAEQQRIYDELVSAGVLPDRTVNRVAD